MSRTGIALAVRKGAPHPDVSTPEALKRALLAAKSVGHTAPAGGGITALHVQKVFERLGIAEQVTPKVKLAAGGPNGRVSVLVASGEAEIGLQQVSELMSNPDVEVIGLLPDALAADHDQLRRHHRHRQGARRRARADQASHVAGGAGSLQDQGARPLILRASGHLNAPFFSSASHFAISLFRCVASFSGEPPMKR